LWRVPFLVNFHLCYRMAALPRCPEILPPDLSSLIESFGQAWAVSEARPRPAPAVISHWTELLAGWAQSADVPLFIRKHANNRGTTLQHNSGRVLIPTDNSPAHWAYVMASRGKCPSLDDIRAMLDEDSIPVALIQKAAERPHAKYHCTLDSQFNVNEFGWKLAHIVRVGLNTRAALENIPFERLREQFINLMSPSNMFVVPLVWAGIAEIETVIKAIAAAKDRLP
jgi:hypothetical protein